MNSRPSIRTSVCSRGVLERAGRICIENENAPFGRGVVCLGMHFKSAVYQANASLACDRLEYVAVT